jgi:hypothetical protein
MTSYKLDDILNKLMICATERINRRLITSLTKKEIETVINNVQNELNMVIELALSIKNEYSIKQNIVTQLECSKNKAYIIAKNERIKSLDDSYNHSSPYRAQVTLFYVALNASYLMAHNNI